MLMSSSRRSSTCMMQRVFEASDTITLVGVDVARLYKSSPPFHIWPCRMCVWSTRRCNTQLLQPYLRKPVRQPYLVKGVGAPSTLNLGMKKSHNLRLRGKSPWQDWAQILSCLHACTHKCQTHSVAAMAFCGTGPRKTYT